MYNKDTRQYILKQSNDKIWNFYYDDHTGLCYSTLTKRNVWTEPVSLTKNPHKTFYVDMDFDNVFHILFQDAQGNLFYSRLDNNSASTKPVLKSKTPTPYNKHLFLAPYKNNINIFYVLQHSDNMILAHQTITDGTLSTPRVVDYVIDKEHPYSAAFDKSGNIYAFYQSSDGKHLQLGYKKYSYPERSWSEFVPVTKHPGNCELPSVINDSNNLHLCYQRMGNRQYELVYQQMSSDNNAWSDASVIHSSIYPYNTSAIISVNGKLVIYWVRDDVIFYSSSADSGRTWSRPARYNFSSGRQLFCLSYKSNATHEYEKIMAPYIPGSFISGLKLAFYSDALSTSSANLSADELKNMLFDSLKSLTSTVDELKESNTSLEDSISRISVAQQNMEKELVKYSVKLGVIENELNQFRHINNKLDTYAMVLKELQSKQSGEGINLDTIKSELLSRILEDTAFKGVNQNLSKLNSEMEALKKSQSTVSNMDSAKNEISSLLHQNSLFNQDLKKLQKEVAELREELQSIFLKMDDEEEE